MSLVKISEGKFPNFNGLNPAEITSGVDEILAHNRSELSRLLSDEVAANWEQFMSPVENIHDVFAKVWSVISHLHAVKSSDEIRAAYATSITNVSKYYTELGQNKNYYEKVKQVSKSKDFANYDDAQKKIITNTLRDFRLSGVELDNSKKQELLQLGNKLSELTTLFEQNIMDSTENGAVEWHDEGALAGLPADVILAARNKAQQCGMQGWQFGLDAPTFIAVMQYAESRALRKELYLSYVTRASEIGPNAGKWNNSSVMVAILQARQRQAELLGFDNYAELSLATKMAKDIAEVNSFLENLAEKSLQQAQNEYKELSNFAKSKDNIELEPWDFAFYTELFRREKFKYSSLEYRQYFYFDNVISGLFEIIARVFSLTVKEEHNFDKWHPDVKLYAVYDKNSNLRGYFYIDLYARDKKRGGAWMDDCRSRKKLNNGEIQHPIAYLNCNFMPAAAGEPILLTHDEVVTLFHEFGHTLQHILTKVDYTDVAGISGVMWDAVEFPSQFMEYWSYCRPGIAILAKHYKTGAALPEDMLQQLLLAKTFQGGLHMIRQLQFSMFDMQLHTDCSIGDSADIQKILDNIRNTYPAMPAHPDNRFQHGFSHIFAGGYAAGYYSYKWAEVLSADAFTRFTDTNVFNKNLGDAFCHNILEQGGVYDANELFERFMSRGPCIEALLVDSGIK